MLLIWLVREFMAFKLDQLEIKISSLAAGA
jgi:hypothetical protein